MTEEEASLWLAYQQAPTIQNRNRLVVLHLPMTRQAGKFVLSRIQKGTHSLDELAGYAAFGLMQAVERYDQEQTDATFKTFAWSRVVGAIWDEIRADMEMSRSAAKSTQDIAKVKALLLGAGTPINDTTLAVALNISEVNVRKLLTFIEANRTSDSLDRPVQLDDGSRDTLSRQIRQPGLDPSEAAALKAQIESMWTTVGTLSAREAAMIELHDYEGLTLAVIGDRWGVTESRACQIHSQAIKHLKRLMGEEIREEEGLNSP